MLPLQVEYFVKGLLEPQLANFEHKTAQLREAVSHRSHWRWAGILALVLIGAVGGPSALRLLAPAFALSLPPWFLDLTQPLEHPRVLLALGVAASTLQGLATCRLQALLTERKAVHSTIVAHRLKAWRDFKLPGAWKGSYRGQPQ